MSVTVQGNQVGVCEVSVRGMRVCVPREVCVWYEQRVYMDSVG